MLNKDDRSPNRVCTPGCELYTPCLLYTPPYTHKVHTPIHTHARTHTHTHKHTHTHTLKVVELWEKSIVVREGNAWMYYKGSLEEYSGPLQ